MSRGWRAGVAVGEGVLNFVHGRWLSWVTAALVAAGLSIPALIDALWVSDLVTAEREWVAAGGRVLVVTNEAAGGVPRAACEATARIDGVEAAAALTRLSARAGLANAPEAGLVVVAAGEGISALLGTEPVSGALIPPGLADDLGVETGDHLWVTRVPAATPNGPAAATGGAGAAGTDGPLPVGPIAIGAVADASVLGESYESAVFLPVAAEGRAEACVVRAAPGYVEPLRDALPTILTSDGSDAIVADRLIGGAYARNFAAEYAVRGLRDAPWGVGGGIAALWLLVTWVRRGRDSLYATLGADWAARAVMRASEGLALLATAAALACLVTIGSLALVGADLPAVLPGVAMCGVTAIGIAVVGILACAVAPLGGALAALKDR